MVPGAVAAVQKCVWQAGRCGVVPFDAGRCAPARMVLPHGDAHRAVHAVAAARSPS
ncbi:hypothetical protein KCH_51270 [Kitasatospora cheerisanensis KCTC 2395]|uniref:Uncharacterized protein n=1 Tax=Kitasatospora cheerisanensis KCTC 2395 TaxID=1348663 RepID=A0A066YY16_9ACTN|nr:hypothetical protein KCH_51270 [Kitasatospora cheerisanensis KCTC 2395]